LRIAREKKAKFAEMAAAKAAGVKREGEELGGEEKKMRV